MNKMTMNRPLQCTDGKKDKKGMFSPYFEESTTDIGRNYMVMIMPSVKSDDLQKYNIPVKIPIPVKITIRLFLFDFLTI